MTYLNYDSFIVPGGHFTWGEYCLLRQWGTLIVPSESEKKRAIFLFSNIENLIRAPLGKGISIASGARNQAYSRFLRQNGIPAAMNGAHNTFEGVDLEPPVGMTIKDFWGFCDKRWPGRMELLKYTPTWVHLDTRNWGQNIRFVP